MDLIDDRVDSRDMMRATSLSCLIWIAVGLLLLSTYHSPAWAQTAESRFYAAERCYRDLRNNPNRQKYRDQWLRCITAFLAVYRHDPHGPWAAAGLYHAGLLYGELYKRSFVGADRQEAIDHFDRVVRHFPNSQYRTRAQTAADQLRGGRTAQAAPTPRPRPAEPAPKPPPAPSTAQQSARQLIEQARANDRRLEQQPELQKFRDHWLRSINPYRQAYQADPEGPLAPAALYGLASSYAGLYRWSRNEVDLIQSRKTFQDLADIFPQSAEAEKARQALVSGMQAAAVGEGEDPIARVIQTTQGDGAQARTPTARVATDEPATVQSLRFWSNPRYTRVVIDADQDAIFTYHELREDPEIGKPQRIYIDVHNSRLSRELQRIIPINDDLLSDARAGQYTADTVRVVVDIKSAQRFKIFSLKNPFRIVLDVWGTEAPSVAASPPDAVQPPSGRLPSSAIVKQLALGVRRIVIDPGHGGRDFGAPGYLKGVHEKNVVLDISKRLAEKIRTQLKCEVILTRDKDIYLSLEERTAIANTQNADLFISVHTNASPNRRASGFETYILNLATDDEAIRVAARENATSMKNISDLDSILKDLMQNAKVNESTRLATYVQNGALARLGARHNVVNKGVKQAPFYVLLGAEMPSILIEAGFISNPEECRRLIDPEYQRLVAQGIVDGIKRYIEEVAPTARRAGGAS